jgi:NAD(P)H-hydrate epimerase
MRKQGRPVWNPERRKDSHKGQNGTVLVIGGSKDYVGAPALAALSALRAGCDIVKVAAPEKAAWAINRLSPDLITIKLDGDYVARKHLKQLVALSRKFDAVVIGPGMTLLDHKIVNQLLVGISRSKVPIVVDADALKVAKISSLKQAIITPHHKEFELFLAANRKCLPRDFWTLPDAGKVFWIRKSLSGFVSRGNVILLKGASDIIVSKERAFISKGGNAGMTVGGTGDILAGLCAGYLAQTRHLFESAAMASHNCKKIGDSLLKRSNFGFGFIASDFLREIKRLRRSG